ncbi:relaxase domain-containing protein [Rariglobus hedericola]|uniref:relaxase domain-containing protein n=1 Tax=Rariglobus hedericola TaxID=2597822 RepID=UPI001EF091EE|nr:relaxase domain-containing protein [Rariglobus hedericola]
MRRISSLCDGQNPKTGERLTQRLNSLRRESLGGELANGQVFYDFTISPPKSVSVVALYQDDRILALHDRAVRTAMSELEKLAATRVRKDGAQAERETGNVIGAAFRHDTSRESKPPARLVPLRRSDRRRKSRLPMSSRHTSSPNRSRFVSTESLSTRATPEFLTVGSAERVTARIAT